MDAACAHSARRAAHVSARCTAQPRRVPNRTSRFARPAFRLSVISPLCAALAARPLHREHERQQRRLRRARRARRRADAQAPRKARSPPGGPVPRASSPASSAVRVHPLRRRVTRVEWASLFRKCCEGVKAEAESVPCCPHKPKPLLAQPCQRRALDRLSASMMHPKQTARGSMQHSWSEGHRTAGAVLPQCYSAGEPPEYRSIASLDTL
eukprot:3510497-Pleurochrysis_carterae.AAC.2